jgi:phosphoglycerol transferase
MKKIKILRSPLAILSIFMAVIFLFLMFRNIGLYPSVFGDELEYSTLSRLIPINEAPRPNYIYLILYKVTNYCGDGFLGCAKLINGFLFILATPFIFLICRTVANSWQSLLVSLLAIIGPINSYTAYFMPESFYFFNFWIFCWSLINHNIQSSNFSWFLTGLTFGVLTLVKPHAIFLIPAIIAYIIFLFNQKKYLFSRRLIISLFSFFFGAILFKFGISYFVAGSTGLTFFGSDYSSYIPSSTSNLNQYTQIFLSAFESFKGHILAISLIYGLPLAISISIIVKSFLNKILYSDLDGSKIIQLEKIAFLTFAIILSLICVTSIFTALTESIGPNEIYRLHLRYYNFALPFFYIVIAGAICKVGIIDKNIRYIIGAIVIILCVYAISTHLAPYNTNSHIDSPEIFGLYSNHSTFKIISSLLFMSLLSWILLERKGVQLYFYLVLPLFVIFSLYNVGLSLNNRLKQDIYDKAGIFTKQFLNADNISKVIVVGSEEAGLVRSLFYIDNPRATFSIIPRGSTYDLSKLSSGKEWVLMIGDHDLTGGDFYQISLNGFTLIRVSKIKTIDFKKDI